MSVKNTLFKEGKRLSLDQVMGILKNHKDVLLGSDWLGLSEVTNHNGEYCQFSCDSQAWSSAVLSRTRASSKILIWKMGQTMSANAKIGVESQIICGQQV
jgi:hypothetical protein